MKVIEWILSEPQSYHLPVPTFKEDLNIMTPLGQIRNSHISSGSTSDTTVSSVEFLVTGATGAFSGANTILIEYSNDGNHHGQEC